MTFSALVLAQYYGHHHDSAWMAVWGTVMMLLLAIVVGVVVWAIVRRPPGPGSPDADPRASARAIVAERYARGEIDRDEYEQKLSDLG